MKLLLTLSYIGSGFCGYQIQREGRTVQGELNRAAKELFGFDCDVTGCSRTDSGVHANTFCVTVNRKGQSDMQCDIDTDKIPIALTAHLPFDISVRHAEWVDDGFHPRYDVKYKEYIYRIYNAPVRDPFEEGRSWHISKVIDASAVEKMNIAAGAFVGKHNFTAFMAQGSRVESTVRDVKYANVVKNGDVITFTVAADGFLYNMVRIMAGTLVGVANGKIECHSIDKIILSENRENAGITAPAHGLYLNRVEY